jgi:hypothetical protein
MDEPQNDQADTEEQTGAEAEEEFDPAEVENDPSQNPPISELKDLKGG